MSDLEQWLAREARRERRRITLEDALVFGYFPRYLWYRLRFFLLSQGVQSLLHVTELALLFFFASRDAFIVAAFVRVSTAIAGSAWWGGLELLRSGVRRYLREGSFPAIGSLVHRWLCRSWLLASIAGAGALAYGIAALGGGALDVADAYIVARLATFGLELVVRAYHSGAYAVRRVYRPVWSIVAPELLHAAVLLSLWPALSAWSVAIALVARSVLGAALTCWFARYVYRDLEIVIRREPRRRAKRSAAGEGFAFFTAAAAQAGANISNTLILSIFFFGAAEPDQWLSLVVYFILAAPLIEASSAWARLFYFDLAKLQLPLMQPYRSLLQKHLNRWSWLVGALLWLPTLLLHWLLAAPIVGPVTSITGLFFLARARLASGQIVAFCERRYAFMLILSALLVGILVAGALMQMSMSQLLLWIVAAMVIGGPLLTLNLRPRRSTEGVLPMAALVSASSENADPGRWVLSKLRPGPLLTTQRRLLEHHARRVGVVGVEGDDLVLWWEANARRRECGVLDGCEYQRWESQAAASPAEGIRAWRERWPTGKLPQPCSQEQIVRRFKVHFPDGICLPAGHRAPKSLRTRLSWGERRAVLWAAFEFCLGRPPRHRLPVDVSALLMDGDIAMLFFVDRNTTQQADRRRWRRWLQRVALVNGLEQHPIVSIESKEAVSHLVVENRALGGVAR